MFVKKIDDDKPPILFEQIDITEGYQIAYRQIIDESGDNISNKIKEKIYPDGIKRVTYSPQTESVYYYEDDRLVTNRGMKWEIFEDRGATIETKLIKNLTQITEIKLDFDTITKEEKQFGYMHIDDIIEEISEFVKTNGFKAIRYRADKKQQLRCRIYRFQRSNHTEEIILFAEDKHLVLRRFENGDSAQQKNIRNMNKTIVCWYYEGLLRMRRLEEKQKKYLRKTVR
ncbi:MAG: hypothetical protein KGD64_01175 [Candidatus Heimdallarchaeota archaeon]|nr:hypothetical protein [Candidatus Heimdallarchaeota archaeon]